MSAPYEKILTSVLADVTITDAEMKLICYLATRPPGWVVIPAAVAKDIKRNERYWVRPTLRLLAARGFLSAIRDRGEHGQLGSVTYRINRDELLAPYATENPRSEPSTVKQSMVPPAETEEERESSQVGPPTVKQSVARPAKTQKASSDHGLSDSALSDNRRVRTDKEPRTEKPSGGTTKRGTRVPEDFLERLAERTEANRKLWAWFRENCPDVNGARENQRFMNHWTEKTGQAATKITWIGTWRNWMLKAQQDAEATQARTRPVAAAEPGADGWVQPVSPFRDLS